MRQGRHLGNAPEQLAIGQTANEFRFSDSHELFTTNTERETSVNIRISDFKSTTGTFWYGVIDMSDTVNWPHEYQDRIDITAIGLNIDKAAATRGSLSLGVVTRIDETDADIEVIAGYSFLENDSTSTLFAFNYSPMQLKCSVVNGRTDKIKTSSLLTGITAINTLTPLNFGAAGGATFIPAVGDIVTRLSTTVIGNIFFGISLSYHSHQLGQL